MATVHTPSGGTTSTAATDATLSFRPCAGELVAIPTTGTFAPFTSDTLSGAVVVRLSAQQTRSRNGTARVLLKVQVSVPIASVNSSGSSVVRNQEITLHTVLTVPTTLVSALTGQYVSSVAGYATPKGAAEAGVRAAIAVLVALMTNQTVDAGQLSTDFATLPFMMGLLGVCPLDAAGTYGTSWPLPPAAS